MSDTPRTDASLLSNGLVLAELSRQLERDLAAMTAHRDACVAERVRDAEEIDKWIATANRLTAERDALRGAGNDLREFLYTFETYRWAEAKSLVDKWDRAALGDSHG